MKLESIVLCSIFLLFAVISYGETKKITVHAKLGFVINEEDIVGEFDDERQRVWDIALNYCNVKGYQINDSMLKVRNAFGKHYNLKDTIKEAGIKDGQTVYVKWY